MSEIPTLKSDRTLCISYNIPISKTLKFWEGIKEGKIYTSKCKKCGKLHFPPVADCGACLSSDIEWVELKGEGKIESFTHVIVKPTSFSSEPPYTVAIAKLKEGVKALAWLVGVKKKDAKVGMKVKLVAKVTSDERLTYEFEPLE